MSDVTVRLPEKKKKCIYVTTPPRKKKKKNQLNVMEFLIDRDGVTTAPDDPVKTFMLGGSWSTATLKHYNAGVAKLVTFASTFDIERHKILPIQPEILFKFVVWASPRLETSSTTNTTSPINNPIKANTIRTYLSGIKAWHTFHDHPYPHECTPKVELLLKTTKKIEGTASTRPPKNPVLLEHLQDLIEELTESTAEKQTALTVALCAFWGMARLGELVKPAKMSNQVLVKDLKWDPAGSFVTISIREAKTAVPGEIQTIHLNKQQSLLDPVSAIRRLIARTRPTEDEDLFSYPSNGSRKTLTKNRCLKIVWGVWEGRGRTALSGHSFRVGGASMRWNFDVPLTEIVKLGRWKSKAYQLYIREYSSDQLLNARQTLEALHWP